MQIAKIDAVNHFHPRSLRPNIKYIQYITTSVEATAGFVGSALLHSNPTRSPSNPSVCPGYCTTEEGSSKRKNKARTTVTRSTDVLLTVDRLGNVFGC